MSTQTTPTGDKAPLGPLLKYARFRLKGFLQEIERLEEIEFPYTHSKEALGLLKQLFLKKLTLLNSLDERTDPGIVRLQCQLALRALFQFLPFAGLLLRSTNVRNAFELFRPFLRLAGDLLESGTAPQKRKTRLVLSSEWDYSPFVLREVPVLPHFVLIGLPAPESANPLLMPLAGHELGHSLYFRLDLAKKLRPLVKQEIIGLIQSRWDEYKRKFPSTAASPEEITTDLFAVESWNQAVEWSLRQSEETFCDLIGLLLFGESFLHAMAYLLSPSAGTRSVYYPSTRRRIDNLLSGCDNFAITRPPNYAQLFEDNPVPNLTQSDEFRLSLADAALQRVVPALIDEARDLVDAARIKKSSEAEINRILSSLRRVVPAEHCQTLADIFAAGWRAFADEDLWKTMPHIAADRDRILKELLLKNIEVFDIENILRGDAT